MGAMSRAKGKRGERELAAVLRELGFGDARRGVQYAGGADSPDVVGIPGLHIEVKRAERLNLADAIAQSEAERGEGEIPVVMHRRSRGRWIVSLHLSDFGMAARAWVRAREAQGFEETR